MPAPVIINFQVGGVSEVRRAFGDVVSYLERLERSQTRLAARESQARRRIAEQEAEGKKRVATRFASATEFLQRQQQQSERRLGQERIRGEGEVQQQILSVRKRYRDADDRDNERSLRSQLYARRQFARAIGGASAQGLIAGGRRVAGLAGATLNMAVGGGFSVSQSVQRGVAASGLAADIANSAWIPNSTDPSARVKRNPGDVLGAARGVGIQFGMQQEDVLGGLQKFVAKTGRLDEGLKVMKDLAELARATGSSFEDIADAAGDVSNELGGNKPDAVLGVMRGIAGQGKVGAVEMRNLASGMAKLAASAGQFSGDAAQNMLLMGMLAQEARGGGGAASATMAATSVTGFVNTLKTPARVKQFAAHGVKVFGADKMIRDPRDIILESLKATKGDPMELKKMFMNIMGERAVTGYANIYRRAEVAQPGSGTAAVKAEFDRLLGGTTMTKADVARGAADRMQAEDAKIAQALAEFDKAVATELIPELMKLIPVVRETTPAFVTILKTGVPAFADLITTVAKFAEQNKSTIEFLASHPIWTIVTAELVRSIGAAGIGQAVRMAILAAIGGGAAGGGGGGAALLGGMVLPVLGGVAGGALATVNASKLANAGADQAESWLASARQDIRDTTAGVRSGAMSPADAKAHIASIMASLDVASKGAGTGDFLAASAGAPIALLGSSAAKSKIVEYSRDKLIADQAPYLRKAIDVLVREIERGASRVAASANASGPANPGAPSRSGGPMSSPLRGGATN